MARRMPRPEDVSRDHIDATVMGFLKGEREADWTEVSLVTLHPREEIRLVLRENVERYRTVHSGRFRESRQSPKNPRCLSTGSLQVVSGGHLDRATLKEDGIPGVSMQSNPREKWATFWRTGSTAALLSTEVPIRHQVGDSSGEAAGSR